MSSPEPKAAATATLTDDEASFRRPANYDSSSDENADQNLEALGYKPELNRNRSTLQVAFMSAVMAAVPYGLTTTLTYPLTGGGPVTLIWGWVALSMIIVCVAASLGEITSVYPTAGGKTDILLFEACLRPDSDEKEGKRVANSRQASITRPS